MSAGPSPDAPLPSVAGSLVMRHQGRAGNDIMKSKMNLMGSLRMAVLLTSVPAVSPQGSPGSVEAKGSTGRPGLWGRKVSLTSYRSHKLRKKGLHSFLSFVSIPEKIQAPCTAHLAFANPFLSFH